MKSGLKDGEKVVSTRLQLLQAGIPVTPILEQETPPSQPRLHNPSRNNKCGTRNSECGINLI